MTSCGRKVLSVTCGDSSPKGRAKASYIGTRNGAYLYRYAPFPVLRLPSMRVPPESRMGRKRPSRHPLPVGEVAERSEDGEGRRQRPIGKWAPSQADDVPRAQGFLSHQGDSSPKGRAKASYIGRICIDTPISATPQCAWPESRMVVKRFPSRHSLASPCGRGGRAQRGRRGQITATSNRKMLAPSQADDVPRAQGSLSHSGVTALPKGEPRHRILAQEMERICIDTLHSLFYGYPQCACRPKVGWS